MSCFALIHVCSYKTEAQSIKEYNELLSTLIQFLSQPRVLMAWIEACYTYRHIPVTEHLRNWSTEAHQLQHSFLQQCDLLPQAALEISKFAQYLRELENDWGPNLLKTPGCIWEEVTAFSPSSFLMSSAIKFHSLKSGTPIGPRKGGREMNKISQTTLEGTFSAVLSIWSSRHAIHSFHVTKYEY